ncbi:Ion transport 2 domain protein [Solidesulfovibrio carbinoliphilus subsp. oakridgensis]|uniref:Ion transport 2 domain protein n=1 Tax=Solidesulfovibrio carbinoliphilus subsp. oakridgensis TaxID=694327 RepID=G7QCB3_9BACT|nr:potassium channel family protein [Solidesulfovibrio carbinoliphilus]EHJ46069.1 Ion transport 2 domain protein [Solidesulfovibrio carbinoliphilus subsp. oakridgensis]
MERTRLYIFAAVFFGVALAGTLGFMHVEGLGALDALYFSVVTITTVGYGDIHPVTATGKLLAMALILSGGGTFFGILAAAVEMFLGRREKRVRGQKLDMIIGLFFSQVGSTLVRRLIRADAGVAFLKENLDVSLRWDKENFRKAQAILRDYAYDVDMAALDLPALGKLLSDNSEFLVRLLENPNILEHEAFTSLLQAVFHLKEELAHRRDLEHLPRADLEHLRVDVRRIYSQILIQWLHYLDHIKENFPYFFSFQCRVTPFLAGEDATVRE